MAELLKRARQLVAGGPYSQNVSEIIAVHAAIYPSRDLVCDHCPAEQGKAYFAIKRWVTQQDNSPSTSTDSTVSKSTSTARFHSDSITLFPHGLGMAFNNGNLTDSVARYILKNDPDAAQFFSVLPPAGDEDAQPEAQHQAPASTGKSSVNTAPAPEGIDYAKLAAAMLDEQARRQAEGGTEPALTASAGGEGSKDNDHSDDKPLPLSRQNKEQLQATYRAELKKEPTEDLLNDDLRDAIAEHRNSLQDPE